MVSKHRLPPAVVVYPANLTLALSSKGSVRNLQTALRPTASNVHHARAVMAITWRLSSGRKKPVARPVQKAHYPPLLMWHSNSSLVPMRNIFERGRRSVMMILSGSTLFMSPSLHRRWISFSYMGSGAPAERAGRETGTPSYSGLGSGFLTNQG